MVKYVVLAYLVLVVIGSAQTRFEMLQQYCLNHLWALDRWLNVLFGGSSKEFISTRVYNYRLENRVAWGVYMLLDAIDPMHCEKSARRDYDPDHSSDAVLK